MYRYRARADTETSRFYCPTVTPFNARHIDGFVDLRATKCLDHLAKNLFHFIE
jgi:hypothetical protein